MDFRDFFEDKKKERRLLGVRISSDYIEMLVKEKCVSDFNEKLEVVDGLPEDAVLLTSFQDQQRLITIFVFYHDSFDVVPWGIEIPIRDVTMRKEYRNG